MVIPTRNTRDLTLRCLESIRTQGGPAEVLVVDDASGDGTSAAVAARFPEARILRQEEWCGFCASVNRGLNVAKGDLLLALNSDTELLPGALAELLSRFDENRRLGIGGHDREMRPCTVLQPREDRRERAEVAAQRQQLRRELRLGQEGRQQVQAAIRAAVDDEDGPSSPPISRLSSPREVTSSGTEASFRYTGMTMENTTLGSNRCSSR